MALMVRNKRINGFGNAVFDVYHTDGRFFVATVEVRSDAYGGMKVLLGALQPIGKERTFEAIRVYEGIKPVDDRHLLDGVREG